MHVPDGFVPIAVSAGGYAVTGALTWYSLRQINKEEDPRAQIPKASLLTAAFFVSSLIHIPVPPTSVHLVLTGLMGVILGFYAFPAILIGLIFQGIMFQHGGLTTLGVNAIVLGSPALVAHAIFQLARTRKNMGNWWYGMWGGIAGGVGVLIAVTFFFSVMILTLPADINAGAERAAIITLCLAHLPLILVEGTITGLLVVYLKRVRPELLRGINEVRA